MLNAVPNKVADKYGTQQLNIWYTGAKMNIDLKSIILTLFLLLLPFKPFNVKTSLNLDPNTHKEQERFFLFFE